MIVATWRSDCHYKADAQKCFDEISEIGEFATPKQIVDKARNEDTELHKCFEWDDTVAAERYRIVQARKVCQSLVFQRTEKQIEERKPEIRVLFKPLEAPGYRKTEIIVKHEDEYAKLLATAYRELHAFKVKYACLSELEAILELID